MALYYNEEMNLKEIGAVLDIGESRVSQLLSANVQKLRKMMSTQQLTRKYSISFIWSQ